MRYLFTLTLFFSLVTVPSWAGNTRALIIGINKYANPDAGTASTGRARWTNLDGATNDAKAFRELLIKKYGFKEENILLLLDKEATRDRILNEIGTHLKARENGDVSIFFYAGHGSQVFNSKSKNEREKLDESLVPVDVSSAKPNEIKDIRDKELRRAFNEVIDSGATLTVILDSCHSGSAVRGWGKARNVPPLKIDANDPSDPEMPEKRGALVLSAAQDDEKAWEAYNEETGAWNGLFSMSLVKALREAEPDESAQQVYQRVRSMMRSARSNQEPVISGLEDRKRMPLFGGKIQEASSQITIAAHLRGDKIVLDAGTALGITPNSQLIRVNKPGQTETARLKVTAVSGLASSAAVAVEGKVESGDVFKIEQWAAPARPNLTVWIPPSNFSRAKINEIAKELNKLRQNPSLTLIEDPATDTPTHFVVWENNGWILYQRDVDPKVIGQSLTAANLLQTINAKGVKLLVNIPPMKELLEKIELGKGSRNAAIGVSQKPEESQYHLTGLISEGKVCYSWVLADLIEKPVTDSPLPLDSKCITVREEEDGPANAATILQDHILQLGWIRGWLMLDGSMGEEKFPYRLALKNLKAKEEIISGNGTLIDDQSNEMRSMADGSCYEMVLVAPPERVKDKVQQRYVYVFSIGNDGSSTLLFPISEYGDVENRFPLDPAKPQAQIDLILGQDSDEGYCPGCPANTDVCVGEPFGMDTYVMLASQEKVNPLVLERPKVRDKGPELSLLNPLETLLSDIASPAGVRTGKRPPRPVPTQWSIQRFSIRSKPKE